MSRAIFQEDPIQATAFPVGQTYEANFGGDMVFHLRLDSETAMQFTGVAGSNEGVSETARITVTPLKPGVFLMTWQDGGGNTFVQVADFDRQMAYLNLTLPDNLEETNTKLIYLEGPLTKLQDPNS